MPNTAALGNDWADLYNEIKKNHDEAYFVIDKAIKCEEEGKPNEALSMYQEGIRLIDKALSIPVECPSNPDITWEKACVMVQKIKKTRMEVESRISRVEALGEARSVSPPPTYEEATSLPRTYGELGDALQKLRVDTRPQLGEILYTHDGVRLYFISPDGTVTSASDPDTLTITRLDDAAGDNPKALLQVGAWIYPLVPGVSPCFRSEFGAFILPDLHALEEGSAVGLMLPPEADSSVHEILDDLLHGIVSREQVTEGRSGRRRRHEPSRLSRGIVTGAQYISHGLVKGAEHAGNLMNYGAPKLMSKLTPDATPAAINPKVAQGIQVAKSVTGTAVQVTGYVAGAIGTATMALGRYLAPHVQRQGTRLLTRVAGMDEAVAAGRVTGALEVAAGAVEGFGTVYDGLERSAGILGSSLACNTVRVVEYKYGAGAGQLTGDTLLTVGNAWVAGNNVKHFTSPGRLVKATAKQTGKGVVEDYRAALRDPAKL